MSRAEARSGTFGDCVAGNRVPAVSGLETAFTEIIIQTGGLAKPF
jgi:hypothetical protein